MAFRLEIEHNDEVVEKTFENGEILLGRADSADVVLDDQTVSRKHARIRSEGDEHTLIVLSKNGMTALEGEQVHGEVAIEDGAILHFGTIKCVFHLAEEQPSVVVGGASDAPTEQNTAVPAELAKPADDSREPIRPTPREVGIELRKKEDLEEPEEASAGPAIEDEPTELFKAEEPEEKPKFEDAPTELRDVESTPDEPEEKPKFEDAPTELRDVESKSQEAAPKFEDDPTEFRPVEQAPVSEEPEPVDEPLPVEPDDAPGPRKPFEDHVSEVLVSWEKIANSDEATREPTDDEKIESNYEKIRKAAEKAEKQSSTNKLRVGLGAVLAIALLAFTLFYEAGGPLLVDEPEAAPAEIPPITFAPGEVDCASEAECMAEAKRNYQIGVERLDNADALISNRFDGWKRLVMVERYAEKAKLGSLPKEFSELEERKTKVRAQLDETYRKALQSYHHHGQYKMYTEMVEVINSVKAHFPHEGSREFKWALAQERALKDQGNYPMRMRKRANGR